MARCEEEADDAANAKARAAKFEADFTALKSRYDRDMAAKSDECEEIRYTYKFTVVLLLDYLWRDQML